MCLFKLFLFGKPDIEFEFVMSKSNEEEHFNNICYSNIKFTEILKSLDWEIATCRYKSDFKNIKTYVSYFFCVAHSELIKWTVRNGYAKIAASRISDSPENLNCSDAELEVVSNILQEQGQCETLVSLQNTRLVKRSKMHSTKF